MSTHVLPGLAAFDTTTILDRIRKTGSKAQEDQSFPAEVSVELMQALVERFPNECPEPGHDANDEMLRRQGQQRVIRMLARVCKDQHPNDFGGQDV